MNAHNQLQTLLEESNAALAKVSKELQATKYVIFFIIPQLINLLQARVQ